MQKHCGKEASPSLLTMVTIFEHFWCTGGVSRCVSMNQLQLSQEVYWMFFSDIFFRDFFPRCFQSCFSIYSVKCFPKMFPDVFQLFFQMFLNRPADVLRHSKQQLAGGTSASPCRSDSEIGDTLPFHDTFIPWRKNKYIWNWVKHSAFA